MKAQAALLLMLLSHNAEAKTESALPLECYTIPNQSHQLCIAKTQGYAQMYDDLLVFARANDHTLRHLLTVDSTPVGESWFWGFSEQGRYLVFGSSEEGHASYSIYITDAFMQKNFADNNHLSFYDYNLPQLLALLDDGSGFFVHLLPKQDIQGADCIPYAEQRFVNEVDSSSCVVKVSLTKLADTRHE